MHLLKSVFRFTLFPGWLLLIGLSGWWFYRAGASPSLVIALTGAVSWLLVTIFERVLPYRADWNVHRGHLPTDVTSFGVIAGVIDPALNIIGPALAVWLVTVASPYGLPIFPTSMPALLQVVLVFLVAEFGKYWIHRWHHESEFLWRFHAMHHSSEHLYSLNNFRLHPFNHVLSYSMSMFPLALIGAPVEPLLVYSCVVTATAFFQHANIDLAFGPLNYVFSTNALHRWHHSASPAEGNRNYGSVLIVWDLLFNTFHLPTGVREPARIGIDDAGYPKKGYLKQLLWSVHRR